MTFLDLSNKLLRIIQVILRIVACCAILAAMWVIGGAFVHDGVAYGELDRQASKLDDRYQDMRYNNPQGYPGMTLDDKLAVHNEGLEISGKASIHQLRQIGLFVVFAACAVTLWIMIVIIPWKRLTDDAPPWTPYHE